jgi:hypothetical protein
MKEILRLLGIKSRIVDVFQITEHKINPHTLIEVYDSDNGARILQDPEFNAEYIIKYEEKPLSSEAIFSADKSRIFYSTNGYNIENEINCTNTIARCFDQCVLYRLSHDDICSAVFVKDKTVSDKMITPGHQKVSFKQFLNQRDHSPRIINLDHL